MPHKSTAWRNKAEEACSPTKSLPESHYPASPLPCTLQTFFAGLADDEQIVIRNYRLVKAKKDSI